MYEPRRLVLISKTQGYRKRLKTKYNAYNGKESIHELSYFIDAMLYGLSSIKNDDWRAFAASFKEAKYMIMLHSKIDMIKKDNYDKAIDSLLLTLNKYEEYLQTVEE